MRTLILLLAMTAPAAADVVGPGGRTIECYCTDSYGDRIDLGQRACLVVNGRAFMATCEMALNNPIWRDTGEDCLGVRAPALSPIPPRG